MDDWPLISPHQVRYSTGLTAPEASTAASGAGLIEGGNDLYGIQNAVSAAAPLTTGTIALRLELDPDLTAA